MAPITFITGNLGKVEEVRRYLGLPLEHVALDIPEIQSLSSEEIVRDKAERAYEALKRPVLVEDVSFVMHGLGKLPGPFIKWFEQELGNERLCRIIDGKDRGATVCVMYGYHDGNTVHIVEERAKGTIVESPRGERSFGWAPIFAPEGHEKTYAELSDEERDAVSWRLKALKRLREHLEAVA